MVAVAALKKNRKIVNMANFGPLTAEIGSGVWGTLANFDGRLGLVSGATSLTGGQPNFPRCLAISWAGILCIHFLGLLPFNGILPGAKFTLRPSLAFCYIGSFTARHSSSGRLPNFTLWYLHATRRSSRSTLGGRTV